MLREVAFGLTWLAIKASYKTEVSIRVKQRKFQRKQLPIMPAMYDETLFP